MVPKVLAILLPWVLIGPRGSRGYHRHSSLVAPAGFHQSVRQRNLKLHFDFILYLDRPARDPHRHDPKRSLLQGR
jgi:hypothetical protein